jgi:hypothetical protein
MSNCNFCVLYVTLIVTYYKIAMDETIQFTLHKCHEPQTFRQKLFKQNKQTSKPSKQTNLQIFSPSLIDRHCHHHN